MGLLKSLGLQPTPRMLSKAAVDKAKEAPTQGQAIGAATAPKAGAPLKPSGYAPKDGVPPDAKPVDAEALSAAERTQADKLLPQLGDQRKKLADLEKRIVEGQAKVDKLLAAAPAERKAPLEQAQAKLAAALGRTQAQLTLTLAHIEALDNPATPRADIVKILAKGASKAEFEELTEIESTWGGKREKFTEFKQSSSSSQLKDGTATTQKEEKSVKLGLDGLTAKQGQTKETTWADGSVKSSSETTLKVGPGGLSADTSRSTEADIRGQTFKVEESESVSVGKGGIKTSETVKTTAEDGSSVKQTRNDDIERGGGKLGVAKGSSTTRTDKDGQALTTGAQGGGGMVAGPDGMGAYGKGSGEVGTQRKSGAYTGVVAGLHANVTCDVGDPKNGLYPVTLKVALGAEVTLKAGKAPQGGDSKGGIELTLGGDIEMKVVHQLDEKKLGAYVDALKGASTGKGSGTALELRVIQAGVTQGWPVAQALYKSGGKPLSKEMVAQLTQAGDSVSLKTSTKKGGKLAGNVKAVSVEFGASQSEDRDTTVTRNADGDLDVDAQAAQTTEASGKLGVSSGIVGGSVGKAHTWKTRFGIEITLDAKKDADGKALAALQALATGGTEAQYEAFIQKFKDRVTVKGRLKGEAETDTDTLGLSLGGAEASIGLTSGVAEQTRTGADGSLVEKTVVGSASSGGGLKVGEMTIGDSGTDEVTARRTGDQDATLEIKRTKKATSLDKLGKSLKKKLHLDDAADKAAQEKKGKPGGLLKAATGGDATEDEVEDTDVAGIQLSKSDLEKIGKMAFNESAWTKAAGRYQEYDDWKAVAAKIRAAGGHPGVVAEELARFVGGDKIHRREVLERLIRPAGNVAIGKAFEFPDSLKSRKADYEKLVGKPCEAEVRKLIDAGDGKKAAELGQQLFDQVEALRQAWTGAKDFSKEAVRAEMLSAIAHRKTVLADLVREASGQNSDADRKKAAEEAFGRLNRELFGYKTREQELFGNVHALLGKREFIAVANGDFAKAEVHMRALSDMYAIWKKDLAEAVSLARSCDIPERRWQDHQPDNKEWERLKKACMLSNF